MCINKKVVAVLAIVGVALYLAAPNLIGAALPLLILAACPLSMVFMMRAMSGDKSTPESQEHGAAADAGSELSALRAEVSRLREDRQTTASTEFN